ncbi:MAG TPA: hypothetical protein VF132_12375 [Rudaea sp.]
MAILVAASPARAVCYFDAQATGAATGTSWADAYTDLQAALAGPVCTEVWVARGIYKPTATTDPSKSFAIPAGTAVYGGFAGNETMRDARDPKTHPTVLSGDIDNDDAHTADNGIDATAADIRGANSYHVVTITGASGRRVTDSTVLDGFTITGGDANGTFANGNGGGLYCYGADLGNACSPTLEHLVFSGNEAMDGGALFGDGSFGGSSSPRLRRVVFSGNHALLDGGAIYNSAHDVGTSSPVLTDITFANNTADQNGGAIYDDGDEGGIANPKLDAVTFSGNAASNLGGAL